MRSSFNINVTQSPDGANIAPYVPNIILPIDGDTLSPDSPFVSMSWECTDPNDDALTYTIFRGDSIETLIEWSSTEDTIMSAYFLPKGTYYWKVVASDGEYSTESAISTFTIDYLTDINNFNLSNEFIIFPNPTERYLTLKFSEIPKEYAIEVFNNIGQLILQKKRNSIKEQIDLHALTNGIYYLKVFNEEFSKTEKIIVR